MQSLFKKKKKKGERKEKERKSLNISLLPKKKTIFF